jgi:hypothetical protein
MDTFAAHLRAADVGQNQPVAQLQERDLPLALSGYK